ncbi:hypothetical protein ACE6H2_018441 [Prunus campanulata]
MRAHHVDFMGCLPSTARIAVPYCLSPIAVNLSVLKYRSAQNFLSISLALLTPILIADQIRFDLVSIFEFSESFLFFCRRNLIQIKFTDNYYEMMQRVVDNIIAVTKESVKTFTYESLNHIVRLINGVSALLLTFLPGKANILEGIHGWELRPTFRGPRFPRWMEK